MENIDVIETVQTIVVGADVNTDMTLEEMLDEIAGFDPDELGMTPEAAANVYALIAEKVPAAHGRLFHNVHTPAHLLDTLVNTWNAECKFINLQYFIHVGGHLNAYAPKIRSLAGAILSDSDSTPAARSYALSHAATI